MGASELRKEIVERIGSLSEERLRAAYYFISYLYEHEDDVATDELLKIEGFPAALDRAEREAAAGQTVPLAKVRRDV
ncbi:MAG TPA: hypothetical protein VMY42_07535 [Thermoguttaceae bacterium]|nr:hypothetical protein [Thermoguttaceae bacterium]